MVYKNSQCGMEVSQYFYHGILGQTRWRIEQTWCAVVIPVGTDSKIYLSIYLSIDLYCRKLSFNTPNFKQ